jgi:hypothetical protein
MVEQLSEAMPEDVREAFADAVRLYSQWRFDVMHLTRQHQRWRFEL